MFKFTRTFFLIEMFFATLRGADFFCPETENSLAACKLDKEILIDLVRDLRVKFGSSKPAVCPTGFTYLPSAAKCYKAVFESHDWHSAGKKCQGLHRGSHLAAITSAAENSALKTFLASELSSSTACISSDVPPFGNLFGQTVNYRSKTTARVLSYGGYQVAKNWHLALPAGKVVNQTAAVKKQNVGNTACIVRDFGSYFWTSGRRQIENNCKSPFVWKLSSDKQLSIELSNWLPGEPSCGSNMEFCMHLWATQNFGWNDIACNVKICPVCEYKP